MTDYQRRKNDRRKYIIQGLDRENPGSAAQGTYCPLPCGKMRYSTRKAAKKAGRAMHSDGRHEVKTMHIYPCDLDPQYFHLTSWTAEKVAAIRERKAARNAINITE